MDTIANFLTSLRNAEMAGHAQVTVPRSKTTASMLPILKEHGTIVGFEVTENGATVTLVSGARHHYKRVSKPGRRMYVKAGEIPTVLGGRGMVILSTSAGLLSGKDARKQKLGGELLCEVY